MRVVISMLLLAMFLPSGAPALAGSSTIMGHSDAMHCYLESRARVSFNGEKFCEAAILGGDLTRRDLAATLSNRGIIRSRNGDHAGALEDHTEALRLVSDLAGARVNRGNVYFRLQQYQKALQDFEAAARLQDGQLSQPHANAGITLMQLRQPARAVQALQQALALEPESTRLAELLAAAKEMQEAADSDR